MEIDKSGFCRINAGVERGKYEMEEGISRMERKIKYYCVQVVYFFYVWGCTCLDRVLWWFQVSIL